MGILAGTALLARIIVLVLFSQTFYWTGIWSDSAVYNQWAHRIVASHDWVGHEPFFMTPLYPYFLAVVYSVFGFTFLPVRIIQLLAGTITVLGVYGISAKLFSRKAGFLAGLICAFYGPFLLSNNLILVETLKVMFIVLAVLMLLVAQERNRLWLWIVPGLSLGLAILCRPTDVVVLLAACLWIWLEQAGSTKEKALRTAIFAGGIVLCIAPVTVRNYAVSGDFVLITSNGGLNFYLGNNPNAVGTYYNVDDIDIVNDPDGRVFAEQKLGVPLRASQVSGYYMNRAGEFITGHPLEFLGLLGKKALLFFHRREIGETGQDYQFIAQSCLPFLSYLPTFSVLGPVALFGCFVSLRHWKRLRLLYGVLAGEFLMVVLFFVSDRYRLSSIPFFMVFAGAGLAMLYEEWTKRDWISLRRSSLLLGLAVIPVDVLNIPLRDNFSMEYAYLGQMYFDGGQYSNALTAYRHSLQYGDTYFARNSLGNVYLATGNPGLALEEFAAGNAINPRQPYSEFGIGSAYASQQKWQPALEAYTRAIAISPRFPKAHLNRGLTLYYLQRYPDALAELERYAQLEEDKSKLVTVYRDIANLRAMVAGGLPDTTTEKSPR